MAAQSQRSGKISMFLRNRYEPPRAIGQPNWATLDGRMSERPLDQARRPNP